MIQSRKIFISLLHRREDVMTIKQNSFIAGEMISRRQMLEMGMPIGNPHLPPFNRREMPFAPIAGAFAAVGAASGALATAAAVVNLAAVAAMYVGVAMTVTGMITGDKDLMKLGAIVGLAGGVTSLAIGGVASLAAGGEFAMGTAGIESMNAANAASAAAQTGLQSTALLGQATNAITPTNFASGSIQAGSTQGLNSASIVGNSGNFIGGANAGAIGNVGGQIGSGMLQPTFSGAGLQALGTTNTIGNVTGQVASQGSGGFFSKLMTDMTPKDWIIAGGTVVSGGAKAMSANQANANAQKKFEYEQGIKNQQIKNLNTVPSLISAPSMA
jgi:hypothetical protein